MFSENAIGLCMQEELDQYLNQSNYNGECIRQYSDIDGCYGCQYQGCCEWEQ